jgi:hypothetical protein
MNLQKLLMLALLAAAVSTSTAPTISKVLGFGHHTVALAGTSDDQGGTGDNDDQGEDGGGNQQ